MSLFRYCQVFFFLSLFIGKGVAQTSAVDTSAINSYKQEAKYMVSFLEFTLNTLGDPQSTATQKETIIQESYLKAFRDEMVQVEDDLIEGRATVTNKDVQAYLKDIDFFFREVRFEFLVDEVSHEVNESGFLYFKVACSRNLQGITMDGDTLNNTQERFIEINLDPEARKLKIASIYTTKLSQQEDLQNWWNEMPPSWQGMFADQVFLNDSISMAKVLAAAPLAQIGDTLSWTEQPAWLSDTTHRVPKPTSLTVLEEGVTLRYQIVLRSPRLFDDLLALQEMENLDLSAHPHIMELNPASKMSELRRINLKGTLVKDLVPLRNLTRLEFLDFSETTVDNIDALRYTIHLQELHAGNSKLWNLAPAANFSRLRVLNVAGTPLTDLSPVAGLVSLRELDCRKTGVFSLAALNNLSALEVLRCSHTNVSDLVPLSQNQNLQTLYVAHTAVKDLSPLQTTTALRVLNCEHTQVSSLEPLKALSRIRKIYCDNTGIGRMQAYQFMAAKPQCLVVYESTALREWWNQLLPAWKQLFRDGRTMDEEPNREQLHQLANVSILNISGKSEIRSLEPLRMLGNLTTLSCNNLPIDTLGPLSELVELQQLDCSHTQIRSLAPLQYLHNLQRLNISHTAVASLEPLSRNSKLSHLYIEHTSIKDLGALHQDQNLREILGDGSLIEEKEVKDFLKEQPDVLIIWRTKQLEAWWEKLPEPWRLVFLRHLRLSETPNSAQLHQMTCLRTISIDGSLDIADMKPLEVCLGLKFLSINGTRVSDLSPLAKLSSLEGLSLARNPISSLLPLQNLSDLKSLNCESTSIESLEPLAGLSKLEELVVSGTSVKDLDPLSKMYSLRSLDCANTEVKKLKDLDGLLQLAQLKCFNTRISEKKIEAFKAIHPNCEVVYY